MDIRGFLGVFFTIFVAELGDKTQLATLLFASDKRWGSLTVFAASSLALVAACGLAVLLGEGLSRTVTPRVLRVVAGLLFIGLGGWYLFTSWR